MAKFIYYRCEDCGGTFRHFMQFSDSPPPDDCALCGNGMGEPQQAFVPQAPGIRKSPLVRSMDDTYRRMEAASVDRAREAADLAGVREADMAHLKITNMKDPTNMREGDIAAITPPTPSPVSQSMTQAGGGFNPMTAAGGQVLTGQQFAAAATVGPHAGAGSWAHNTIVAPHHRQMAQAMQRAGQLNR